MNCKVCGNTSAKNPSISFFRFPKENSKCREWAVRCDLLALYERHGTLRFYKSFRICSDHFEQKDIIFDGRKNRLLQHAMPQILVTSKDIKEEKQEMGKFNEFGEIFKRRLAENLCRLCAEEDKNLIDIYGFQGRIFNLENKLKHLPLVINKCDILPLRVCNLCLSKVNQFHDFFLNCIKAEAKLRILLDSEDSKFTNPNAKCEKNFNWNSGMEQNLNVSPDSDSSVKVHISPHLMMCFPRNVEDDYYNQELQVNLTNEDDSFLKHSEPDFTKSNQSTEHTNFIKEVDFSRNVIFEHDYSHVEPRDQILYQTKKQTENDQNFEGETKLPCDICLEAFQSSCISNAQSITNANQSDPPTELLCESCKEIFCSKFELDEHTSQHLEGSHQYKICDKKFHQVAFLEKKSISHQLENSYACFANLRSSRIYSSSDIKILKSNQNKSSHFHGINKKSSKSSKTDFKLHKLKCQFCDRFFKSRQHCLAHENKHKGETPYECQECGKGFRSRPSLRQHRSVHSDKRLYRCHECGTRFKRKDTLSNHLRIHTGERPYICKICGFAFKQRGDCIKHEKNHSKSFKNEIKEEALLGLEESRSAVVGSIISNSIIDAPQTSNGIPWDEENNSLLPPFIRKPEEITPVNTLEDIISGRLIPFNF